MANIARVTQTGLIAIAQLSNTGRVTQAGLLVIGSTVTYALAGTTGTYSESGLAATLKTGRHLPGTTGAYSEVGKPATLQYARAPLQVATGAYSELGQSATLKLHAIHLVAAPGLYAELGMGAVFAKFYLFASTGHWSASGPGATLTYAQPGTHLVSAASKLKARPTSSSAGSISLVNAGSALLCSSQRASCVPRQTYFYPVGHSWLLVIGRLAQGSTAGPAVYIGNAASTLKLKSGYGAAAGSTQHVLQTLAHSKFQVGSLYGQDRVVNTASLAVYTVARSLLKVAPRALMAGRLAAAGTSSRVIIKPNATGGRDIHVAAQTRMDLGAHPGDDLGSHYTTSSNRAILLPRCAHPVIVPFGTANTLILRPLAVANLATSAELVIPGTNQPTGLVEALISGLSTDGFPFSLAETGNGVLLMANGIDPMIRWDCLTTGANFAGVAAPDAAVAMTPAGNGLILGYRWAYCRFIDRFGNYSNLSPVCGPVLMGRSMWIDVIRVTSNGIPVCTSRSHGLTTSSVVSIFGVDELPVTGTFTVVVLNQNTFALAGIVCEANSQTSKPAYWVQGAGQVVYNNVPVPADPKITQREILRNLDGNAQTFYVDVCTTDVTAATLSSARLDDSLSAQTAVPLVFEEEMPEASRFDLPPGHKCVLEYHLGRVFAAVDRPYDIGNVVVSFGSVLVQGIGTNWISTFVDRAFYCDGAQRIHHVARVVNGQFLLLDQPYQGASSKFAAYSIRPSDTESRLIYYSEPDLPEAWPSWNAFAVPDHGDEITGLMVFKSYLFIIERRHISQFTFKAVPGRDGFIFLKSHRGCLNNRCRVLVEDAVYMLDEAGVHRFDGENSTHLSAKINNLFNDPTYPYQLDWASPDILYWHAVQDPLEENIRWFVDFIGKPRLTHAICYDYRRDRWFMEQYPEAITSGCQATVAYRRCLGGSTARRVLVLGEGTIDGISSDVYGSLRGQVASSTATTITAVETQPPLPINLAGVPVAITGGVAKGQAGIIVANLDSLTMELWQPWAIQPRPGDTFLIGAIPFLWRNGWVPYIDQEEDYSRDLSAIFKPTNSGASFDLQLWFDYADQPQVWTTPRSIDGVTTTAGSPDININTDRARGYAFQRMQSRREQYSQSNYFVSLGVSGFQGTEATRVFELIINGCYSQARQH